MYKIDLLRLNDSTLLKDVYIEYIYYTYLIIKISSTYYTKRLIIDLYDTTYKVILNDILYTQCIEYIKLQKYDKNKIPVCECFKNNVCADCLFYPLYIHNIYISTRLPYKHIEFDGTNKYIQLLKYSVQILSGILSNANTLISKIPLTILDPNTLYNKVVNIPNIHIDINSFFYTYNHMSTKDLYVLNESILIILRNTQDTKFIKYFYMKLGVIIKYIHCDTSLLRLLIELTSISAYKIQDIVMWNDVIYILIKNGQKSRVYNMYLGRLISRLGMEYVKKYIDCKEYLISEYKRQGISYLVDVYLS